jgi:hypothetical protein
MLLAVFVLVVVVPVLLVLLELMALMVLELTVLMFWWCQWWWYAKSRYFSSNPVIRIQLFQCFEIFIIGPKIKNSSNM